VGGGAAWAYDVMSGPGFVFQNTGVWGKIIFSEKGQVAKELVEAGVPQADRQRILTIASIIQREGRFEVGPEVVGVLQPDREPDQARRDPLPRPGGGVLAAVARRHRVAERRRHVTQARGGSDDANFQKKISHETIK
jgi:hypothetical protein